MFSAQRIYYEWYGKELSYLLITIKNTGAVSELWYQWIKKGKFMNDVTVNETEQRTDKVLEQGLALPQFLARSQDGTRAEEQAPEDVEDKA